MDTSFLVVVEMSEHAEHLAARNTLAQYLAAGDQVVIVPQVISEFIHVVTDSRRFTQPLDITQACGVAQQWWTSKDVVQAFPDNAAMQQFCLAATVLLGSQAAPGYVARRDLSPGGRAIAAHNQSW
jgi:predicted nucleic acid-binding protein